jgi:hypothetical protein
MHGFIAQFITGRYKFTDVIPIENAMVYILSCCPCISSLPFSPKFLFNPSFCQPHYHSFPPSFLSVVYIKTVHVNITQECSYRTRTKRYYLCHELRYFNVFLDDRFPCERKKTHVVNTYRNIRQSCILMSLSDPELLRIM